MNSLITNATVGEIELLQAGELGDHPHRQSGHHHMRQIQTRQFGKQRACGEKKQQHISNN
jgi:hypothetical protein